MSNIVSAQFVLLDSKQISVTNKGTNETQFYTAYEIYMGVKHCKGLILFHILISSHFLLLASIFEFQCFGLFSGLTCPKFMGLEPLCYSYFCAFLGLLSVT